MQAELESTKALLDLAISRTNQGVQTELKDTKALLDLAISRTNQPTMLNFMDSVPKF